MAPSTIERAFQLARSGQVADLPSLKRRLKSDGCRAVDALLAPRTLGGHLDAICAAAFKLSAVRGHRLPESDDRGFLPTGVKCPSRP
jgi:hypothetical protein